MYTFSETADFMTISSGTIFIRSQLYAICSELIRKTVDLTNALIVLRRVTHLCVLKDLNLLMTYI